MWKENEHQQTVTTDCFIFRAILQPATRGQQQCSDSLFVSLDFIVNWLHFDLSSSTSAACDLGSVFNKTVDMTYHLEDSTLFGWIEDFGCAAIIAAPPPRLYSSRAKEATARLLLKIGCV